MDWNELENNCSKCTACSLCSTRTNLVFGIGNKDANIMFIGEGPGEQEDLQGEPFVGRAGKLLDVMLKIMYLDRKDVYIANIVKCRPPLNRDPLPEEKSACSKWLDNQIELVNPKIIVCLGRISASSLISPDFKITKMHGQWVEKGGIKYIAIYHPSALLRDITKRPDTFIDLKKITKEYKQFKTEKI